MVLTVAKIHVNPVNSAGGHRVPNEHQALRSDEGPRYDASGLPREQLPTIGPLAVQCHLLP